MHILYTMNINHIIYQDTQSSIYHLLNEDEKLILESIDLIWKSRT